MGSGSSRNPTPSSTPRNKTTLPGRPGKKDDEQEDEEREILSDEAATEVSSCLHGNPNVQPQNDVKIVRIFTSSTFTDTKEERNALMERVYPRLKEFCQKQGYEFQVVDMRWGVRSEAEDDHMTTEICLKELTACQRLSTGPNFITLLSHKYGYCPFPRVIEAKEFETITRNVEPEEKENILDVWFKRDDNAIPAMYVLQPISAIYPDFKSSNQEKNQAAREKWWSVFDCLQQMLQEGARKQLTDPERVHFYQMSVTEREIQQGVLTAADTNKHCLWFKRNISDIQDVAKANTSYFVSKFYDGSEETRKLFDALEGNKLKQRLSQSNVENYSVPWSENGGIDPSLETHKQYIERLCVDFEKRIQEMVIAGIKERQDREITDPVYTEVIQHITFCANKCKQFHGRQDMLDKIKAYVTGGSELPLVVHGESGCGKTSLIAMAARKAWEWMNTETAVVYRFIGTTQASSTLRPMLNSLVSQLLRIFIPGQVPRQEFKFLVEDFKDLMSMAQKKKKLVILLDSLDQLDNVDGGRHLHWLPRKLPPNVKLILSTLPQEQYGCFPRLKGLYPKENCYIEVPSMKKSDVKGILDKWLNQSKRRLTSKQRELIVTAYNSCPLPLFLKLCYDEALRWHSYDPLDVTVLQDTVTATIQALFERLEKAHGRLMVSTALACLTASQGGLSESELEDVLSLNDEVLNDVYEWWTPPIRRLPPLLWVRVRNDLEEYLVNRGVDGVRVIYWYHRQFIETAQQRYLATDESRVECHLALAEFFLGIWADMGKPYVSPTGEELSGLRHVAKQPLEFEPGEYNLRRLMQLPYHLTQAREREALKSQCLCNYEFLVTKLKAASFRLLLQDLKAACSAFPDDQELHVVMETFQLARDGLNANPGELAGQLVGRIHGTGSLPLLRQAKEMLEAGTLPEEAVPILSLLEAFEVKHQEKNKHLSKLLGEAEKPKGTTLLPHLGFMTPPGGQLLHKLAEHTDIVVDVDITEDGDIAATGSYDNTAKIWDIETGEMLQSVEFPENVGFVKFCHGTEWLAVSCWAKLLYIVDVDIGTIIHEIRGPRGKDHVEMCMPIAICHRAIQQEYLVAMRNQEIDIYNIEQGKRETSFKNDIEDWSTFHQGAGIEYRHLVGKDEYVIYAAHKGNGYHVRSISDHKFRHCIKVFDPYEYNKLSEEPDLPSSDHHHISALVLTADGTVVVLCNSANQDIHLYHFEKGIPIKVIQSQGRFKMKAFFFPPGCDWFYHANKNMVGAYDLRQNSSKSMLPHPCKVRKVVGIDNKFVITVGEDSILRIWDKTMEPFKQDMSMLTGKVKVESQQAANQNEATFLRMMEEIVGDDLDTDEVVNTRDLLTTKTTENYWTKDTPNSNLDLSRVLSKFYLFQDKRYLGVSHSDITENRSYCFSIWETAHVSCIRRMFFPQTKDSTVCVWELIDDNTLLISEKRTFKLLDLVSWKVIKVFQGELTKRPKPYVIYLPKRKEVLTESENSRFLQLYSIETGQMNGHLLPSDKSMDKYLASSLSQQALVSQLQVTPGGDVAGAMMDDHMIYVWNVTNQTLTLSFNPYKHLGRLKVETEVNFTLTPDGSHMIITRDLQQAVWESHTEKNTSCGLINLEKGKFCGYVSEYEDSKAVPSGDKLPVPIIRMFKRHILQAVHINEHGKGHIVCEEDAGSYARLTRLNGAGDRMVTWCSQPKEKTLRFWAIDGSTLKLLGSFTPDKEVTDIALVHDDRSIMIDSPGGVVKLTLCGQGVPKQQQSQNPEDKKKSLFPGVDLDLSYNIIEVD